MDIGTVAVRAGLPDGAQGQAFLPGPTFAGTYHLRGDPGAVPFTYGRYANPTWSRFEQALSELEDGDAVVFSSGMAAVAAVLSTALSAGDVLVVPSDCYYGVREFVHTRLVPCGIDVRSTPTVGTWSADLIDGATLVWLETPSNPGLDVCDIAAVVAIAHQHGALVAVDNTTATPLGQRPFELGADFVVTSDSKGLTGHADLILGHAAAREPEWGERLRAWRSLTGAIPGPMEVWLAHRSLGTADIRLERQCANAAALAVLLARHAGASDVRYPGLPSDPGHSIARHQMRRFGPVVSFALPDAQRAERFLTSCQLVFEATSFGGLHTTAERRARWGGDDIPAGFIRFSAGCEATKDLEDDVRQALENALT